MKPPRRLAPLLVACVASVAIASLGGCAPSREGYVNDELVKAGRYGGTSVDDAFRLAICGWKPDTHPLELLDVRFQWNGDDAKGIGEANAHFVGPGKDFDGEPPVRCRGKASFRYQLVKPAARAAYFALREIHRVGDVAAFVGEIEKHAKPLALATKTMALGDAWKLPDGRFGAAFAVTIPSAGPYKVTFTKLPTRPAYEAPSTILYEAHVAILEGDASGALGFFDLEPGVAVVFVSGAWDDPVELEVVPGK